MREIVFDTETTGLSPATGDRLVEIGCIELVNRVVTGNVYHAYFNPERTMDPAAQAIHGLSDVFLADKPLFADKVEEILDFIEDAPLVAHNARFDFSFMNHELGACGRLAISESRMIDTLALARVRHPGAKHSLDALCTRYGIDRSHRIRHGALLDAELLAQVYIEMTGGRQIGLGLAPGAEESGFVNDRAIAARVAAKASWPVRLHQASDEERARHRAFLEKLVDPLWLDAPDLAPSPTPVGAIDEGMARA
jgi:DNA polymerase-3 subunit epsilon